MFKKVKGGELQLGMYVILPPGFMHHKFEKHQILIDSEEKLEQVKAFGLSDITVDMAKSPVFAAARTDDIPPPSDLENYVPLDWDAKKGLVPEQLKEVISDKKIEPMKKAGIVYTTSVKVMQKLLEDPTVENIRQYKDSVQDMVHLVLRDVNTASFLAGLTAHDYYTYTHSVNVGVLALLLAKDLLKGSDAHDLNELAAGFFLPSLRVVVPILLPFAKFIEHSDISLKTKTH